MKHNYTTIKEKVGQFIQNRETDRNKFTTLAKEIFTYQYENNRAYRKFCRKRRVHPSNIHQTTDIPPVPINAFKEAHLACSSIEEAQAVFMTSGTTNPEKRGKNIHRDLDIYDLSMKTYFKESMVPDVDRMKMVILFPTEEEMPNSSLAHYLRLAKDTFGTADSEYVVSKDGFDMKRLKELLKKSEETNESIFILGATFSFIAFLDDCKKHDDQFQLPKGSRVMDTGGAKGQSRTIEPAELKQQLSQLFSIPESACGNMYGMTELSSQIYDQDTKQVQQGHVHTLKQSPPWMKTVIVDPETMKEKPEGEKGIIVHYDLANYHSVLAIMTEDIGVKEGNGFHLLGRAEGVEAKGCSLAVEEFLSSNREGLSS